MTLHILTCLQHVLSRLKESRVFQFNPEPEWHISVLRWITLIFYGWLGAVVVHLLWPWLAYLRPERLFSLGGHSALYGLLQISWCLLAVILVLTLQDKFFIRFPRKSESRYCIDMEAFARYPTLHVSVVVGILILLSAFDGTSALGNNSLLQISSEEIRLSLFVAEKDANTLPVMDAYGVGVFFCFYLLVTFLRTEFQKKQTEDRSEGAEVNETLDLLTCSDDQFEEWITQERDEKTLDFFDREPYVARMLGRIQPAKNKTTDKEVDTQRSKGQILLGEFGSGKTTIVNLLEKELGPEWIISRFDCWQRSGKPEELATQLMEQVIHDVGQQFEVASLAGLPESFARALYGDSHWWHLLHILLRPGLPDEVIGKLDTLLRYNNCKLLLVVENVDRNEEREHFINIIAAILNKLQQSKNLNHIHFIFSADEALLDAEFLYRIADYKESVDSYTPPEVILRFMALCLKQTLDSGKNGGSLILPYLPHDFDFSKLKGDSEAEANRLRMEYVAEHFSMTPYDEESSREKTSGQTARYQLLLAFSEVLSNPRKLKNILRNAYGLWNESLKGEIHLFDLLLYCASVEDGELKNLIKGSASEILEGKFNGKRLFASPFQDAMDKKRNQKMGEADKADLVINVTNPQGQKTTVSGYINQQSKTVDIDQTPKMASDSVNQNARAQLAFYILNGDLPDNYIGRFPRSQSFIEEYGKSAAAFSKYRSALRRGCLGANIISDQEFLKNYSKASAVICDKKPLKFCLDLLQKDLGISKNLLKNMVIQYFSSVSELHQFLYNTIIFADEKYVETFPGALEELIHLCFEVMNFDGSGGEQNSFEFQRKLIEALKQLDEHKHYSYLMRVLSFLLWSGTDNHFSQVVTAVIETMFTHQLSVRMGLCFRGRNHQRSHKLHYEFIHFLPALNEAQHLINRDTFNEACRSFLIVTGIGLVDEPRLLYQFAQRYEERLAEIKRAIQQAVKTNVLEGIELNAWQELERVLLDKPDGSDKEPQPD